MSAGSAKAGTISRLIRSARTEFASKGLAGARVGTIARQAGVTKQLIYHYYHSKEELFAAVLSDASCSTMPKLVGCEFTELSPPDALAAPDFKRHEPGLLEAARRLGLDLVFIAADGRVVSVKRNAEPLSEAIIPSGGDVTGVLEVNAGTAARIDVKPGDRVVDPMFKP